MPAYLLGVALLTGCAETSPITMMTDAVFGADAGSATSSINGEAAASQLLAQDPILAYIATATPGETGTVPDPAAGSDVWVMADRLFHAASGHLCRRYRIVTPSDPRATRVGLACKDASGRWYRSRLNINPIESSAVTPLREMAQAHPA